MVQNVTQDVVQILPQRNRVSFQKARELAQVSKARITPGNGDSLLGWAGLQPLEASSAMTPPRSGATSDRELLSAIRPQATLPHVKENKTKQNSPPITTATSRK